VVNQRKVAIFINEQIKCQNNLSKYKYILQINDFFRLKFNTNIKSKSRYTLYLIKIQKVQSEFYL